MDEDFEAYLRADDVTVTAADVALLRAIDDHGSLNAAASALGRSYARAHGRLTDLEDAFGSLVERRRGGAGGGGSELTPAARDLLARFDRLRETFSGVADVRESVFEGRVTDRNGELATVETPAGRLVALVPDAARGERVAVGVRADTVTLHGPEDAPADAATSARNRFEGTVTGVDAGETVALVSVDLGASATLDALLTLASVDRLGLGPGSAVVASFKATAVRGVRRE